MIITDKIYRIEEISENVIIELINSKTLQRLKEISQHGLPQEYYHLPIFSRYEHSIGVLVLLRRLKAELKEQIAGLLHDVSHTAFSHVIDWVIGDPSKEDHQDRAHSEFIGNSEIPSILEKYGIDYREIAKLEDFPLLERKAPGLCVDRFDYAIREIKNNSNQDIADLCISDLSDNEGQLAFKSEKCADFFAREYAKCQREHWAGKEAKTRYYILSDILKKAISRNIISFDDIKKTDSHVISLLKKSQDAEIADGLRLLKDGFKIEETEGYDGIELLKKFRYIDPEVVVNGRIRRLSEISDGYREFLDGEKKHAKNNPRIRIKKIE